MDEKHETNMKKPATAQKKQHETSEIPMTVDLVPGGFRFLKKSLPGVTKEWFWEALKGT